MYFPFDGDVTKIPEQEEKAKEAGMKYGGQIIWRASSSEFARFYPRPAWAGDSAGQGGGILAMENEFLADKILKKDMAGGFTLGQLLQMVGDKDAPATDQDAIRASENRPYTTQGDAFSAYLRETMAGVDGDSMLILWARDKDSFATMAPFPTNFAYEHLERVVTSIREGVACAWDVPPILAGIQSSGAISKDDIESAVTLMYMRVRRDQQGLAETFETLLKHWHNPALQVEGAKIENYVPKDVKRTIDPLFWAELTPDEKRAYIQKQSDLLDE
jgi:hypothetical protein